MKYRKLRIAWSVAWGVACLLLVVLWVRSYSSFDHVIGPSIGSFRLGVDTGNGWLTVRNRNGTLDQQAYPNWTLQSTSDAAIEKVLKAEEKHYKQMEASKGTNATFSKPTSRFGWKDDWRFQFPYWLLTVLLFTLAAAPWLRWSPHFSLRTLLIGITVAAIGLGWIVYAHRK